jgi:hypothetical protein
MGDNELWREKPPDTYDNSWDLQTFQEAINAAERALTKPPFKASTVTFPARLLDDLTDEHVELLFKWVAMPEQEKYSYWRKAFAEINERFSTSDDLWSAGQSFLSRLKKMPEAVPRAPVFLLVAEAWLSQQDKKDWQNDGNVRPKRAEANADELTAIIRELDILLHDGNIPQTRHGDAAGQNLINAVFGLLDVLKAYDERKRQTTHLCELFSALKIRVTQMDIRNWRRRERDLPPME